MTSPFPVAVMKMSPVSTTSSSDDVLERWKSWRCRGSAVISDEEDPA
jgi:hypothetical protein